MHLGLRYILAALGLVLLLSAASGQESKNPSPTPSKPSEKDQQNSSTRTLDTADNKKPAKQQTFTPNLYNDPVNESGTKNGGSSDSEPSSTNWWIMVFTGVLAGVAIAQAVGYAFQVRYMSKGLHETRRAADAAKKSAEVADKSLRFLNRPFVDVHFDRPFRPEPSTRLRIIYTIKNSGSTWAFIKRIETEPWDGPDWLNYTGRSFSVPEGKMNTEAFLGPNATLIRHVLVPALAPETRRNGVRQTLLLFCYFGNTSKRFA